MKDINLKIMRPIGFHKNIENIVQKANKNVANKSGWKIIKQCPLCLSKKNENWLVKNKIIIKNCLTCGLGFSTKQPNNLSDTELFDYSKGITDFVNKNYNLKSYNEIKKN